MDTMSEWDWGGEFGPCELDVVWRIKNYTHTHSRMKRESRRGGTVFIELDIVLSQ